MSLRKSWDKTSRSAPIWRHNSFLGHATMMRMQCRTIIVSDTATDETKAIAQQILDLAVELEVSLHTRKDQE